MTRKELEDELWDILFNEIYTYTGIIEGRNEAATSIVDFLLKNNLLKIPLDN